MLILSRKVEDAILIGENIEIRITKVEGDTVKIGIDAPRNIKILRKEVKEQMEQETKAAAQVTATVGNLQGMAGLLKGGGAKKPGLPPPSTSTGSSGGKIKLGSKKKPGK